MWSASDEQPHKNHSPAPPHHCPQSLLLAQSPPSVFSGPSNLRRLLLPPSQFAASQDRSISTASSNPCRTRTCLPIQIFDLLKDSMGPRWKGKGSETKALADPMSKIISELQSSLVQSEAQALLSGCSALVAVEVEQTELLNRACFGRPVVTSEKDKQWFQLGMEEAFYLCHSLKCLKIVGGDNSPKNDEELWQYMKAKKETFPLFYKAYSHIRNKNWVARLGSQYGVDFVAYRHHPSLVHSEYAVLVLSEGGDSENGRLRVWSDIHCTVRLCGGVAKTLLILTINKNGQGSATPSCLEQYAVEERTITRWSPKQCREDHVTVENGIKVWHGMTMS